MLGIVNGTTNFILDKMDSTGAGFAEALDEATGARLRRGRPDRRRRGLRRRGQGRDPRRLAFHTRVTAADVHREGITEVTAADIASAKAMGCVIKLLAICERVRGDGALASASGCTRR